MPAQIARLTATTAGAALGVAQIARLTATTSGGAALTVASNAASLCVGQYATLTVSGGTAPYTVTATAGTVSGSGSSWQVANRPRAAATTATVTVTDSLGAAATASITLGAARVRVRIGGAMVPVAHGPDAAPTVLPSSSRPAQHLMVCSNWATLILTGASSLDANLDAPANVTTLRTLAGRYDHFIMVDPYWSIVGAAVRDRLRQYATEAGRTVTMWRYVDSSRVKPDDQTGTFSMFPASALTNSSGSSITQPTWTLRKADGSTIKSNGGYILLDPGSAPMLAAAKAHIPNLAAGWDGIFLDLVDATYMGWQATITDQDPDYPLNGWQPIAAYAAAKLGFVNAYVAQATSLGVPVMANTAIALYGGSSWPQVIAQGSSVVPFVESFATKWDRSVILSSDSSNWPLTQAGLDLLTWAATNNRRVVINGLSEDQTILGYNYALALTASTPDTLIYSGSHPNPASNAEYNQVPAWLSMYDAQIGTPAGPATGTTIRTRAYTAGSVSADTGSGVGVVSSSPQQPAADPTVSSQVSVTRWDTEGGTYTNTAMGDGSYALTLPATASPAAKRRIEPAWGVGAAATPAVYWYGETFKSRLEVTPTLGAAGQDTSSDNQWHVLWQLIGKNQSGEWGAGEPGGGFVFNNGRIRWQAGDSHPLHQWNSAGSYMYRLDCGPFTDGVKVTLDVEIYLADDPDGWLTIRRDGSTIVDHYRPLGGWPNRVDWWTAGGWTSNAQRPGTMWTHPDGALDTGWVQFKSGLYRGSNNSAPPPTYEQGVVVKPLFLTIP